MSKSKINLNQDFWFDDGEYYGYGICPTCGYQKINLCISKSFEPENIFEFIKSKQSFWGVVCCNCYKTYEILDMVESLTPLDKLAKRFK